MEIRRAVFIGLCSWVSLGQGVTPLPSDPPIACGPCDEWNATQEPFRVFGNTYYVGTHGLASILVTSDSGHVLIDGGLPDSAPLILQNVATLGFDVAEVCLPRVQVAVWGPMVWVNPSLDAPSFDEWTDGLDERLRRESPDPLDAIEEPGADDLIAIEAEKAVWRLLDRRGRERG